MRRVALLLALGTAPVVAQTFGSPGHYTEQGGEAIYRGVCAACHMPDGRGAVGAGAYPALKGNAHLASPEYVTDMVLHGRGAMPGFAATLSARQVADVVTWLQANFGGMP